MSEQIWILILVISSVITSILYTSTNTTENPLFIISFSISFLVALILFVYFLQPQEYEFKYSITRYDTVYEGIKPSIIKTTKSYKKERQYYLWGLIKDSDARIIEYDSSSDRT